MPKMIRDWSNASKVLSLSRAFPVIDSIFQPPTTANNLFFFLLLFLFWNRPKTQLFKIMRGTYKIVFFFSQLITGKL